MRNWKILIQEKYGKRDQYEYIARSTWKQENVQFVTAKHSINYGLKIPRINTWFRNIVTSSNTRNMVKIVRILFAGRSWVLRIISKREHFSFIPATQILPFTYYTATLLLSLMTVPISQPQPLHHVWVYNLKTPVYIRYLSKKMRQLLQTDTSESQLQQKLHPTAFNYFLRSAYRSLLFWFQFKVWS